MNAVAVVLMGLSRLDWPASIWLRAHPGWILSALIVTAAVPVLQTLIAERGEKARRKALQLETAIQPFLAASLIYLARHGGADWEKTGIQAFVVRRRGLRFHEQHVRLAKVRLGAIPTSSIEWTKGKGVIGRCWATKAPQFVDLEEHFAPYEDLDAFQWSTLSDEETFGLSHADYQQLNGKYGIVAAVPIINRSGRYLGCVTADSPPGVELERDQVLESLATTASLVNELLSK